MTLSETVNYQCIGCGAMIQTTEPQQMGYLPASALEKGLEKGQFYCQRCFRLRHYNEVQDLKIADDVFLEKLSEIADDRALIINVIDLFDFEGSLITGLSRFVGKQPYVVVINKFDLLPKGTRKGRTLHWAKQELQKYGLQPEEVLLVSAKQKRTLDPLIELIEANIRKRNIYIVGVTNVGKSTLINHLIQHYGGEKELVTTSNFPGTTLDLIHIPLTEDYAVIDTPGIMRSSQITHLLSPQAIQKVLPRQTIKPRTYQLNPGQTLFIEGLARFDFNQGEKTAFTFYLSNHLQLHRTKLTNADEYYRKHLGGILALPAAEDLDGWPALTPRRLKLEKDQDIAVSGLTWFRSNQAAEVTVWVPQGVGLSIRPALI